MNCERCRHHVSNVDSKGICVILGCRCKMYQAPCVIKDALAIAGRETGDESAKRLDALASALLRPFAFGKMGSNPEHAPKSYDVRSAYPKTKSFDHCGICGADASKAPFAMGIVYSNVGPHERMGLCDKCANDVQTHILYLKSKPEWYNSDPDIDG